MPPPPSRRLSFRPLGAEDIDALAALYADPEMRRHFPDGVLTREQTRAEIEWHRHGWPQRPELGLWATLETATGAFLGRCGLLPWTIDGREEIELAYLIDKRRWGEGFATEAAQAIVEHARTHLGLRRLISLPLPDNIASIRVAQKAGMQFEREGVDEHGPFHLYACRLTAPA